jgi:hypothetical protein
VEQQTALIQAFFTGHGRHVRSLNGFLNGIPDAHIEREVHNYEE